MFRLARKCKTLWLSTKLVWMVMLVSSVLPTSHNLTYNQPQIRWVAMLLCGVWKPKRCHGRNQSSWEFSVCCVRQTCFHLQTPHTHSKVTSSQSSVTRYLFVPSSPALFPPSVSDRAPANTSHEPLFDRLWWLNWPPGTRGRRHDSPQAPRFSARAVSAPN